MSLFRKAERLNCLTVAQAGLINQAAVRLVIAVSQRRQIAADQRLTRHNRAFSLSNSRIGNNGDIVNTILRVCTKGIIDGSPQAPAVTGIRLTSIQDNIAPTYPSALNLNVHFLFVFAGNLNNKLHKNSINYFTYRNRSSSGHSSQKRNYKRNNQSVHSDRLTIMPSLNKNLRFQNCQPYVVNLSVTLLVTV